MHLIGQRWRYEIGNSIVHVENAFSWTLWAQERLVVNDEEVQSSGGRMRFRQSFREPWLTMVGEDELSIRLASTAMGIKCAARLAGAPLTPTEIYEAKWHGSAKSWPDAVEWKPQPGKGWAGFE